MTTASTWFVLDQNLVVGNVKVLLVQNTLDLLVLGPSIEARRFAAAADSERYLINNNTTKGGMWI